MNKYTMVQTIIGATTEDVIQWAINGHTGDVRAFVKEALMPKLDAMAEEQIAEEYAAYFGEDDPDDEEITQVCCHCGDELGAYHFADGFQCAKCHGPMCGACAEGEEPRDLCSTCAADN